MDGVETAADESCVVVAVITDDWVGGEGKLTEGYAGDAGTLLS
jgi:hypothetical protein